MREFLSLIINPVPVLYFLLLVGLILCGFNRKRTGKIIICIAGLWFFIITTPFLPKIIIKSLESQYPQLADSNIKTLHDSCNIIVLGSGLTDDKNLSPNNQLTPTSLSRLVEGIRIHKMIPDSRLILSGYGERSEISNALVYYRTALILGIDSVSMVIQALPSNTRMEAAEYVKNFGTENKLIVVTSANHMPRAIMLFHRAGIFPIAAPTNFFLKYGSHKYPWRWIPSSENVVIMEAAIHEELGIMWEKSGGQ
jgi:uncharacterized SAM-binding protein YcdF (DUF218 family)